MGSTILKKLAGLILLGFTFVGGCTFIEASGISINFNFTLNINLADTEPAPQATKPVVPEPEAIPFRAEISQPELIRSPTNEFRHSDDYRTVINESAPSENLQPTQRQHIADERAVSVARSEAARLQRLQLNDRIADITAGKIREGRVDQDVHQPEVSTALGIYAATMESFSRRNYSEVVKLLNEAITHNPQDPTFFYFRGLAYSRLGHHERARNDFKYGGMTEAHRSSVVSAALERIQPAHGWHERKLLETFRPRN